MAISEFVGVIGLVFGVTGTVLGVLNYLRDRAKVIVGLQWDMQETPTMSSSVEKLYGVVRVTNVGRRPTYVSHAALRIPRGRKYSRLLLGDSIAGTKLTEGDSTHIWMVTQDGLVEYADCWREVVAEVSDHTGKIWCSKKLRKDQAPSWARSKK